MNANENGPVGTGSSYIRVSRKVQVTERQRASINDWAARRNVQIAHKFEDQGARDKSEERADFQRLLQHVKAGRLQWVVIEDLDRFGVKDPYELCSHIYDLRRHGCQLWSVADDKCISEGDDATVLMNVIAGLTSEREQGRRGLRALSSKMEQARKGTWVGGYIPYGLDVLCERDGEVVWRMIAEGKDRRVVIDKHGNTTRYDGSNVVPPHTKNVDKLYLAPSVREERIATLNDIFRWFADEAISTGKIANRLNSRDESAVYAERWYAMLVEGMLRNPVYLGKPVYNKNAHGRFYQYVEGKISKAPRRKNYIAITGRKRTGTDLIASEKPLFDTMISPETFERVQAKLADRKAKRSPRAPKADDLWLAGLVYCGKCGAKMNGSMYASQKGDQRSFLCSTAVKFGVHHNPSGCRSHRVKAATIEKIVFEYLETIGEHLSSLKDQIEGPATDAYRGEKNQRFRDAGELLNQAAAFIRDALAEGTTSLDMPKAQGQEVVVTVEDGQITIHQGGRVVCPMEVINGIRYNSIDSPINVTLFDVYDVLFKARREALIRELEEKKAELVKMVEDFRGIKSPMGREIANTAMEKVEARINQIDEELLPVSDVRDTWVIETCKWKARVDAAQHALKGQSQRRRAEDVRQVIGRLVCHFEYRQYGQHSRSRLTKLDIEPVEGDGQTFTNGASPVPG